jgi:glycosyltransferase involved in cell wall biosynthesis
MTTAFTSDTSVGFACLSLEWTMLAATGAEGEGGMTTVAYVGAGILPFLAAGDKAFLLHLAPLLRERGMTTRFFSLGETPPGPGSDEFRFLKRFGHDDTTAHYTLDASGTPVGYHHVHDPLRQTLELAATLLARSRFLRAEAPAPAVYHWMDISTVLPALKRAVGHAPIVASSLEWKPRGGIADAVRAHAYSSADLVITGTHAAAEALTAAGCRAPTVVAPWSAMGLDRWEPASGGGPVRLVWTGYIRQIRKPDLVAAWEMACRLVAVRPEYEITFCLKPQFFDAEMAAMSRDRVRMVAGDAGFVASLADYDAMLSPVLSSSTTMAPPLSWVEALSAGLPIVTTRTRGIEELVTDGAFGLIAEDMAELERRLADPAAPAALRAMRPAARAVFERTWRMDHVADRYAEIYRALADDRVPELLEAAS